MTDQTSIEQIIARIRAGSPLRLEETNLDEVNTVGIHGQTPLMAAAERGNIQAVKALVHYGALVNATGSQKMTALHEASASGHTAIVGFLLSHGAEVDSLTVDDATPLMCAAAWGHLEAAKVLLKNGADSRRVARTGETAVDIAREKGEDAVADWLEGKLYVV